MTKKYHIYLKSVIHIMPLSLEWLQCVLVKPSTPSTKAVNLQRTSHKSVPHNAPTAPIHTPMAVTTAWHGMPSAKVVPKKRSLACKVPQLWYCCQQPAKSNGAEKARPSLMPWKGEKADIIQVSTEETPHMMSCSSMWSIVEL